MVKAGALDQAITIERALRVVNAFGEAAIGGWAVHAEIWAHVVRQRASELAAPGGDAEARSVVFIVRDGEEITPADRLKWDGRAYNILSVTPAPRAGELMIEARFTEHGEGG